MMKSNIENYKKIKPLSKEVGYNWKTQKPDWTKSDEENYFCYTYAGRGVGYLDYRIISNPHNFTYDEMALICDKGNLCFGYINCGFIRVFTD